MPYFVFRINNHREYACLEQFDDYRAARNAVRTLRSNDVAPNLVEYRMIFADSASRGETLLRTPRDRTPSEDD